MEGFICQDILILFLGLQALWSSSSLQQNKENDQRDQHEEQINEEIQKLSILKCDIFDLHSFINTSMIPRFKIRSLGYSAFLNHARILPRGRKSIHSPFPCRVPMKHPLILVGSLIFTIILTLYLAKYKFYEIKILDQGLFDVGYRLARLGTQKVGVFYPTFEKGQPASWIQTQGYYKDMYDFTFMNPLQIRWAPFQLFKACSTFLDRIKMPAQTGVSLAAHNPENYEFQVVIFSHGLSSHMNCYSSYCSWLASQGYIVVSIEHPNDFIRVVYDEQFLKRMKLLKKILYMVANQGLQARTEQMGRVYQSLISNELFQQAFPQIEGISLKKVHFFGHSFGGITCIQTLANLSTKKVDLSLVEHIFAIDPYFYPLSKHTLEHSFDQHITIVNSQTFMDALPPELGMRKLFKTIVENNPSKIMPFVLKGSDHIFSTDFPFVCGNGMTILADLKNYYEFETFISMLQLITASVLKGHSQEQILKKADEKFDCKQLKRKNFLRES